MNKDGITINELSKMANVTIRTIRFYTDEGVLDEPAGRDRYARYTRRHYLQLSAAKTLKAMFLPLRVIRDRIASLNDNELEVLAGPVPTDVEARFAEAEHPHLALAESPVFFLNQVRHAPISSKSMQYAPMRSAREHDDDNEMSAPLSHIHPSLLTRTVAPSTTSDVWHRIAISANIELHVREEAMQEEAGEIRRILATLRKRK
jgi:DNA-binding transcriptional MerR regulator